MGNEKVRFAEHVNTDEIKDRVESLLNHKIIRELDGLLKELNHRKAIARKIHFIKRIREEMTLP